MKSIIVTGGGSGIGRSICEILAKNNFTVQVLDMCLDSAYETASLIESKGGKAYPLKVDVTNFDEVNQAIQNIGEASQLFGLVNSAGIAHIGNIESTTSNDMDKLYQVNIKGAFYCSQAVIPFMKANNEGVIVNLASIAASVGIQDRFAYSMTKGAVLSMTYSIARDYIDFGIRCNSVSPARVHTPFVDNFIKNNYPNNQNEMFEKLSNSQPIKRMGTPKEVASMVNYLFSENAAFMTGTDFPVDGGFIKLNN